MVNSALENALALEEELALLPFDSSIKEAKEKACYDALLEVVKSLPTDESSILNYGVASRMLDETRQDGFFQAVSPAGNTCRLLRANQAEILQDYRERVLETQKGIMKAAASIKRLSYRVRRHALDEVIKKLLVLEKLVEDGDKDFRARLSLALGQAYFLRGRIIRQKGFTVPMKKLETLRKALEYVKQALGWSLEDTDKKEALRLQAMVHIDLALLNHKESDFSNALQATVTGGCTQVDSSWKDIQIILALAEHQSDKIDRSHLESILASNRAISLAKARAALLLCKRCTILHASRAIRETAANAPLFHEDWQRLVMLLKGLQDAGMSGWKGLALKAWQACCLAEKDSAHGCHVRWYWSRQRDLYDLAFHAADSIRLKAQIADSLKARPAFHLGQMEKEGLTSEERKKRIDQEMFGLLGGYIKDLRIKPRRASSSETDSETEKWQETPAPWIAVHFYLNNGFGHPKGKGAQKLGYALIHDSTKEGKDAWRLEEFDYRPIWSAYWTWQENYQKLPNKQDAAPDLEQLCIAMGKTMPWLFKNEIFPSEQPVTFISHDFLHRLPLHMAIEEKDAASRKIWAQARPSTYLPAWWSWAGSTERAKNPPSVIINLEHPSANIKAIISQATTHRGTVHNTGNKDHLLGLTSPPGLLFLLMHGHSHPTNPFLARLDLYDGAVTHQDLLDRDSFNLKGTPIFLCACETDLVPPLSSSVDEHLSLSVAFLLKGASEVLGGLWKVREDLDQLGAGLVDKPIMLYSSLWAWQQQYMTAYLMFKATNPVVAMRNLYVCAAPRTLGLPLPMEDCS